MVRGRRKIMAVTGARSEYDILFPVLQLLQESDVVELTLLVTGAHLSDRYGHTVDLIEKDGFKIAACVDNLENRDDKVGRVISLGNQIPAFANVFDEQRPDLILVAGDREEAISTALTGAYMDIPVAHLAGGDIAKDGNIDNSVRYATSKFAHLHFTILPQHNETLLKLGEDAWRIFTVGNPALDRFLNTPVLSTKELSVNLSFDVQNRPYLVLIQHPIITDVENEGKNIRATLDAIIESGYACLINYPNSDAGNFAIIEAYNEYVAKYSQLFLFKNLDRLNYVNVLRNASCLLGNSSSGIIEAPSLGLPVVNIGPRQRGRIHADNVLYTDNDRQQILDAIYCSMKDESYRARVKRISNPYGDGHSAEKMVKVLTSIEINDKLIHKNITY